MTNTATTKTKTSAYEKLILLHLTASPKTYLELLTLTEANPAYLTNLLRAMIRDGFIARTGRHPSTTYYPKPAN